MYCIAEYPLPDYFLQADCWYPCTDKPIQVVTPLKMPLQGPVEESAIHDYRVSFQNNESISLSFRGESELEVVIACALLHNVCLTHGDVPEPQDE